MTRIKAHGRPSAGYTCSFFFPQIHTSQITGCTCPRFAGLLLWLLTGPGFTPAWVASRSLLGSSKPPAGRRQLLLSGQNRPFHRRETSRLMALDRWSDETFTEFPFPEFALEVQLWVMVAHWGSFINLEDRPFQAFPTKEKTSVRFLSLTAIYSV